MDNFLVREEGYLGRDDKRKLLGWDNKIIWFSGLSGSGKTTLARNLERYLHSIGAPSCVLDGDNTRSGLNKDLGFSEEDREENIRRIGEVAKIIYDSGIYVVTSFISPFRRDRDRVRELVGNDFFEVYVSCPLEVCMERDPKGIYEKAHAGQIKNFSGIDSPY